MYDVDPVHTFVMFRVRHLVVGRVDERFTTFEGQFTVIEDETRLFDRCDVILEPASIDTHVKMRDDDLMSPRLFDAERFPRIVLAGGGTGRGRRRTARRSRPRAAGGTPRSWSGPGCASQ